MNRRRAHYRVADAALGRAVPKTWRVLRVNGVRGDHRPENLLICDSERTCVLVTRAPTLLEKAVWLGEPGASVRLLRDLEPKGERFCVRCRRFQPTAEFASGGSRYAYLRWYCGACA